MSSDKKVAILATNGFEESELFSPKEALERENIQVKILSPEIGKIKAWKQGNWSKEIDVNFTIRDAETKDFDLLILPGGVINPDKLRRDEHVVNFIRRFFLDGKPVAAICHGAQTLIDAEVVKDKTMTSFFSIKKDLQNAGANWIDSSVVLDDNLITSRNPDDLQAFIKKILDALGVNLESN